MDKKIALITGATAGIGKATALKFAEHGYHLIVTGRRNKSLEDLSEFIRNNFNMEVMALNFDVRNRDAVEKKLNSLPSEWQKIDVLINNAGLAAGLSTIQEGEFEDWEIMIDTNIKGLLYVSRCIMPMMIKNGFGHIINLGSIAGKEAYLKGNVYCATKHAVDAITKSMRIDMLPHKIKVTSINPGAVETEFAIVRYKGDTERASQTYKGFEPLRAEDIADTIYFAASRPAHVNINDIIIMPTAQANTSHILKEIE